MLQQLIADTAIGLQQICQQELPLLQQPADWQTKYRLLMQLGKKLPALPEKMRQPEYLFLGCESRAWLLHYQDPVTNQHFWAFDSDARIVKGLIILILAQVNGFTAEELAKATPELLLNELQLQQNISQSRSNGLLAVLNKIKAVI